MPSVARLKIILRSLPEMTMKRIAEVVIFSLCTFAMSAANATLKDSDAAKLTAKYNCQGCHATDRKLVGPAYEDVARKYSGDFSAAGKLESKVKNGGAGVWGLVPMPPNDVPQADLSALIQWILALK
jgi:cytochrome c